MPERNPNICDNPNVVSRTDKTVTCGPNFQKAFREKDKCDACPKAKFSIPRSEASFGVKPLANGSIIREL